ncbi:DUF3488 and transglutaminase-like domain-containing protein [Pelomonas sp. CA6]|uniref:transglutaminase family protein n=1 Tax=Pelomonas sp. CA6 TaxID=2907999 RepID=UPI001F4B5FAB|nr:DUF3488 and transglutaminase-like domain-containing protein [Pelomonas sp. CA6]MCH7342304.1 DUF3488 and transglutaminase-like domain-containing protein [Pelomonas sp. CA6]
MKPLPREARDTLFLLATIAATLVPHAGHLPVWASAAAAAILCWRAVLAWRSAPLPGRWSLFVVLGLVLGLTLLTHRTLLGREAGITMLAMLMGLKTLELRARRDAFVVFFLGFFLVLTQFLYSQSLLTALWTLLCVWALLSSLVLAQMPLGQPRLLLAARIAARNTLWGMPVMLALFLLFPRLPPLWGLPQNEQARTGLSDQMELGAFTDLAVDDSIALRLKFSDGAPPPAQPQLYFRGQVLSRFDGKTWHAAPTALPWGGQAPSRTPLFAMQGTPRAYEMTVEPLRITTIPLLEHAPGEPGAPLEAGELTLRRAVQGQWVARRPVVERLRLQAQAYPAARLGPLQRGPELLGELDLPAGLNPRSRAWALEQRRLLQQNPALAAPAALSRALAGRLLQEIRGGGFEYTLAPGLYGEASPHRVDEFWFDRRQGFCEHFAAAFVVLMRSAGVPARVVTGFQGADPQLSDGYLVVRMSQAHAWAEYWLEGEGWQRVDPTAAVAPERIRGRPLRSPPGVLANALSQVDPRLWAGLRQAWEVLENRWQQQVLNYARSDQFELLKRLGFARPDWEALLQTAGLLLAASAGAGALWSLWRSRPHDAWTRQQRWLIRRLQRLGVAATAQQSPRHWARLLADRHGAAATPLVELLLQLERQRYAAGPPAAGAGARLAWRRQFQRAAARLRRTDR